MNRIDLTKLLRQVSANMDPGHEGVGMDIKTAKRQVDKLIEQGFLEFEDNQNLRLARHTDFQPRPVTVTFEIDGGMSGEAFLQNLKRIYPTTPMCLGPISNLEHQR